MADSNTSAASRSASATSSTTGSDHSSKQADSDPSSTLFREEPNKALGEYVQIPRIFQRKLDSCGGFTVKGGQSSAIRAEVEPASRIRTDARAQPNRFEDCARPGEIVCVPDRQDCE